MDIGAGATASLVRAPAGADLASVFRTFDVGDIAESCAARRTEGKDDGLTQWRFERLVTGVDFEDEGEPPIHPFVVGFLLGDTALPFAGQGDFLNELCAKLAPFVLASGDQDLDALDRDPIQDNFNDSRPEDEDEYGARSVQVSRKCQRYRGQGDRAAFNIPAASAVTEVLDAYGLDGSIVYNQLCRLGPIGSSPDPRIPIQCLTAPRPDRLKLLAGHVESCHTTVDGDRFSLHRRPCWSNGLAEDTRSLTLSLGKPSHQLRQRPPPTASPPRAPPWTRSRWRQKADPCRAHVQHCGRPPTAPGGFIDGDGHYSYATNSYVIGQTTLLAYGLNGGLMLRH